MSIKRDCRKCGDICRLEWREAGWDAGIGPEGLHAICVGCGFTERIKALDEGAAAEGRET
jgi:hypothetical protein